MAQRLSATTVEELLCRNQPHRAGLASGGLWCSPSPSLECVTRGSIRVVIQCGLKLSTRCTGSGASQGKGEPPPVPYLGSPGTSYKVIFRWLLLMPGLEVPRKGQVASQGQLPLVSGLGPLSKSYGVHRSQMLLV